MPDQPAATRPYVFLSYSSTDRDQAVALAERQEADGIRVWLDRRNLVGGMSWDAAIVEAIKHCAVFAVLCTQAGVSSPNVMQELRLAWEEQRPTLPLRLAAVTFPSEMRYILAGRQWVEAVDRPEDAWLSDLHQALAGLGLAATVPPPSTDITAPSPAPAIATNLPASLTSFVGREQDLAELGQLLAGSRLVTLTGPGGTGKTRLATETARTLMPAFLDGTFFVDLAPLADSDLVPAAVAQVLGVQEVAGTSVRDSVLRFLRDKRLLLLLDNYEHLLAAAEFSGSLLQACPLLILLVTSRAPLRVRGEREYPVQPLVLPERGQAELPALIRNPTVALFVARAQDVRPDFALTHENAATIAAICTRLDGLPLAIELAAARTRVLPPATLLSRLEQRLPVLTGGARDIPARQQTLRSTIAWSYDLLEPAEQTLFRRLAVFTGGCTLELAEAVCNIDGDFGIDVLDGISSLVEKSLLRETTGPDGEPRYGMLETIREFALEQLDASGEAEAMRRRHAAAFLALAEAQEGKLLSSEWAEALRRLEAERHNLRTVHSWAVAHSDTDTALRLVGALWGWLYAHGGETFPAGRVWAEQALALPGADAPTARRAAALRTLGMLRFAGGDSRASIAALREAEAVFRSLGLHHELSLVLAYLAMNYPATSRTAAGLLQESQGVAERAGSLFACGMALNAQAQHAWWRGEYPEAWRLAEAFLAVAEQVATPFLLWAAWKNLAYIALERNDPDAGVYIAHTLAEARSLGSRPAQLMDTVVLSGVQALVAGQPVDAAAAAIEGLQLVSAQGVRIAGLRWSVEVLACALTAQAWLSKLAARLLGAAAHARAAGPSPRFARLEGLVQQAEAMLRETLGPVAFQAAYTAGYGLTLDEAAAEALAAAAPSSS